MGQRTGRAIIVGALVLLVATVASCGADPVSQGDAASAQARWERKRPGTYHWRADGTVDGRGADVDLIVDGRTVVSSDGDAPEGDFSVEGLFALVRSALRAGARVVGSFDPELGYPERLQIAAHGDHPKVDLTARDLEPILRSTGCKAAPRSPTDLSAEPATWLLHNTFRRWQDGSGCDVRVDVISDFMGAEHCGWQDVEYLTIGVPVGSSIAEDGLGDKVRTYLWDPEGVLDDVDHVDRSMVAPRDRLPATAADTGYRRDGAELWIDDADVTYLYRVHGARADRFVLDPDHRILCE